MQTDCLFRLDYAEHEMFKKVSVHWKFCLRLGMNMILAFLLLKASASTLFSQEIWACYLNRIEL